MQPKLLFGVLLMIATQAIADSADDVRAVLQLLLNAPQLTHYYHFDVRPQRKPLHINNQTATAINPEGVTAVGEAIKIVQGRDQNALEITELLVDNDRAKVVFTFQVEGVIGSANFSKHQGVWHLDVINVAEH